MRSTLIALAMILAFAINAMAAVSADFHAGAGKAEIQIAPDMLPLEGLTSQHDPLTVRALVMDDGKTRSAIVVLEQPSVSEGTIAGLKASLTKLAGVTPENAIVVGTHTTSAPHATMGAGGGRQAGANGPARPQGASPGGANAVSGGPQGAIQVGPGGRGGPNPGAAAFANAMSTAAESAITQAASSMQPAKVGFGLGVTDININRDLPTPKGWAFGNNDAGFSDKALPVVRIDNLDGKPIAVLMNVSVRSVVMDGSKDSNGGRAVSADLAGAAARNVENWYGGNTVALFLMGAAVDQAPIFEANRYILNRDGSMTRVDIQGAGFTLLDLLGERLGAEAVQTTEAIQATSKPAVNIARKILKVPSQGRAGGAPTNAPVLFYSYVPGPDIDFPVVLMRIGDIAIVGVQPELASSIGARIKAQSPFQHTIVAVMVDGNAKYLVDAQSFDHFTEEARGSQYARGAADVVLNGIEDLLTQMHN